MRSSSSLPVIHPEFIVPNSTPMNPKSSVFSIVILVVWFLRRLSETIISFGRHFLILSFVVTSSSKLSTALRPVRHNSFLINLETALEFLFQHLKSGMKRIKISSYKIFLIVSSVTEDNQLDIWFLENYYDRKKLVGKRTTTYTSRTVQAGTSNGNCIYSVIPEA
ncbi:uncharacterized protein LOC126610036 [Malus sylvestris]|uniref:uncharacterized protein LOC126610036 n=1 Tax=Malus sylvestris TaxID=3752 RepID=UPI0021AC3BD6|nr:uncharacterized protein LOC126610036 [Malus sylvestris]